MKTQYKDDHKMEIGAIVTMVITYAALLTILWKLWR